MFNFLIIRRCFRMSKIQDALVWVDCEMTGLRECDRLLEIAVIVTDKDLKQIVRGPDLVIKQSVDVLDHMNDWCKRQFGWTSSTDYEPDNLGAQSLRSEITETEAERQIIEFLTPLVEKGKGILAGNTVHVDKRFIDKYLPRFSEYLHYRIIDVSTVKELVRRWQPETFSRAPEKKLAHRALEDIEDSINELKFYRDESFRI